MNKKIKVTILGLFAAVACLAQYEDQSHLSNSYPDTLVLQTENKNEIIFMFDRMGKTKEYFTSELWKSMLGVMETAIGRSDTSEGILVWYSKKGSDEVAISVSTLAPVGSLFTISKDEMKERLASRMEFLIVLEEVAISFYVNESDELEEIKELNLESVWSQIRQKFEDQGKNNLYRGNGVVKYGTVSINKIEDYRLTLDNLEITPVGIGLGFYRDRFIPDISTRITFNLYDRLGNDWIKFGFMYTQQFLYSIDEGEDFNPLPNGWLTGFFKINTTKNNEFGIGFGGLVNRKGDFYDGTTFKLSLYNRRGDSKFTFSPEIVAADLFKEVFPALRFGLSF